MQLIVSAEHFEDHVTAFLQKAQKHLQGGRRSGADCAIREPSTRYGGAHGALA